MATLAAIILALLKAIPALESLVGTALKERAAAREAGALKRKERKINEAREKVYGDS